MTNANTHILGFESFVINKIVKTVLFVIVKCLRTVQRIYNKEAATSAVVGAEKHFDEVHYSGAVALSCKVFVGTQTTNQYGRETL